MPTNLKMPTGFEALLEKAKSRRTLANKLAELGLQNNQGYRSWAQVLGQLADAWAGRSLGKEADTLDSQYNDKLLGAFSSSHNNFQADVKAGMTPEQLQAKYGDNQFTESDLKPYAEAIAARQTERARQGERLVQAPDGGYKHPTDMTGPQFDPNKDVYVGSDNQVHINPVKVTASRLSQATGPAFGAQTSMPIPGMPQVGASGPGVSPTLPPPDPYYSPAPGTTAFTPDNIRLLEGGSQGDAAISPKGAIGAMQVMPSTAHNPGFGVRPASSDSPAEYDRVGQDYAAAMLRRYGDPVKAAAAYNGGPGRTDHAIATGGNNFLSHMPAETQSYAGHFSSTRQPDGQTIDGRPYWMVNGIPYDNPEGR